MRRLLLPILVAVAVSAGCSTSTHIDEFRVADSDLTLDEAEKIVVLGRRQAGEYETEPAFISCIGGKLAASGAVSVFSEQEFIDRLYPWFEPRTAPLNLKRMRKMLRDPMIAERIDALNVRYMIWVDGNTEVTDQKGSMSCVAGPGGGGCLGFSTWDKASEYEAIIWDLKEGDEKGRVRVDAKGSSYVIAVIAPIPFIAQVQGQACNSLGKQLRSFFTRVPSGG